MKERKSFSKIVLEIKKILTAEKELSIKQIADKTGSQWRTIEKALSLLKSLDIVKERPNKETERVERLFSLKQ
jgi:predicted transcriptional regulator